MKKIIIAVFCIFSLNAAQAADDAYINAMKDNLKAMGEAKTPQALQEVANTFERISKIATQEWLPVYYAAIAYLNMSQMEQSRDLKDQIVDKARPFVDKALELAPQESEVILLEGYWTTSKLIVDPAGRGQTLGPKSSELFNKAIAANPENPRAYLMKAYSENGKAEFFGTSKENACALFKKSITLFEKAPANGLAPKWGKDGAVAMASKCE